MMKSHALSFVLPTLLLAAACSGPMNEGDGGVSDAGPDAGPERMPDPDAVAILDIHSMDIWGQDLPADVADLTVTADGVAVPTTGWPLVSIDLIDAATYEVTLTADDHETLNATLVFDGTGTPEGLTASTGSTGAGLSVSRSEETIAGRTLAIHRVLLGARHRWFSAQGRPARRGNQVELLTSGEEAWGRVAEDLVTATDTVHMATWWWSSDFELVRDEATHVTSTEADRRMNTIIDILDNVSADKRVLVGQFISQDGIVSTISTDSALQARGAAADDGFEHMGQANETRGMFSFQVNPFLFREVLETRRPELINGVFDMESLIESTVPGHDVDLTAWPIALDIPIASYHQKFATVDGRVAFVGGMNLRPVDWDTDEHLVYDPRRMNFSSTTADRMAVVTQEEFPDNVPRKDYMTRIEGPLVQDVDELFQMRWSHLISEGSEYSANASDFTVRRDQAPIAGGVQAQLTATLPAPFDEHAIAETWFNAVENAEQYIFIEDQYFRIPMLAEAIVARMMIIPDLQLVVVTPEVDRFLDPGCEWTGISNDELTTRFPGRYHTFQLRTWDFVMNTFLIDEFEERFTPINLHSKLLIVDDAFLSVGSCNKNNRGIVYEGELNIAVFDRAWVAAARRRVLELMLPPGTTVANDVSGWIAQMTDAASWNQFVFDNWDAEFGCIATDGLSVPPMDYTPSGFLYPLSLATQSDCLITGVGPDMT